ncbi:MAG: hypothetical protein LBE75_09935 [Burkholderiales bacterium]|nr:hypothetical protein [Burkholderiales bacterium]
MITPSLLTPHQSQYVAFQNPLSNGVVLADEVGLGKTIEAKQGGLWKSGAITQFARTGKKDRRQVNAEPDLLGDGGEDET